MGISTENKAEFYLSEYERAAIEKTLEAWADSDSFRSFCDRMNVQPSRDVAATYLLIEGGYKTTETLD